jgi:hypothetical protein
LGLLIFDQAVPFQCQISGQATPLVVSAPGGPARLVPGVAGRLDDQDAGQAGDLVAVSGMIQGREWLGVADRDENEEGQREHGEGGPSRRVGSQTNR